MILKNLKKEHENAAKFFGWRWGSLAVPSECGIIEIY
jgi:hypothetical protein